LDLLPLVGRVACKIISGVANRNDWTKLDVFNSISTHILKVDLHEKSCEP
jgi:hypothetical protein